MSILASLGPKSFFMKLYIGLVLSFGCFYCSKVGLWLGGVVGLLRLSPSVFKGL